MCLEAMSIKLVGHRPVTEFNIDRDDYKKPKQALETIVGVKEVKACHLAQHINLHTRSYIMSNPRPTAMTPLAYLRQELNTDGNSFVREFKAMSPEEREELKRYATEEMDLKSIPVEVRA